MKQGTLEVDAFSRDDQTKLGAGKLLTIDNQIDPTTGTAKLKAVFDNKNNQLWPNQFVNASLLLETRRTAQSTPVLPPDRSGRSSSFQKPPLAAISCHQIATKPSHF